jgi:signal transduction histidine kinase
MQRNLTASEHERRAIAADVHDGPVQDLAGVAYALTGLRDSVAPERGPTMDRVIEAVRHAVHSLRRLMIDIFPPELSGPGLAATLEDLAQPLRDQGVAVDIDTGPLPGMSPEAAAVLYRSAKESLSNVAHHAEATQVWITLQLAGGDAVPCVQLEIADDGVGFGDPATADSPEGHLGLRLLRDRVADIGGYVTLHNRADGGAVVAVFVPAEHGR